MMDSSIWKTLTLERANGLLKALDIALVKTHVGLKNNAYSLVHADGTRAVVGVRWSTSSRFDCYNFASPAVAVNSLLDSAGAVEFMDWSTKETWMNSWHGKSVEQVLVEHEMEAAAEL